MSQEDLVFELRTRGQKISRVTLSAIENNTGMAPRADLVATLAEIFDCDIGVFFCAGRLTDELRQARA